MRNRSPDPLPDRASGRAPDRVRGVLLGLAAGDRIGGPARMALRVAESLRACHGFDPEDIGARYLAWWRDGAFDTGPTAAEVLRLVDAGASFADAAARVHEASGGLTAGCNPAHRSAPLAMCMALADEELAASAAAEAALTHRHPVAGDVAAAVVVLCRALIRSGDWPDALARSAEGRLEETRRALRVPPDGRISPGGYAPDALAAAVHHVDAARSFDEALRRSVNFAGPSNYCPVLVGSIAGARWGAAAIDEAWLAHHGGIVSALAAAAEALAEEWVG